MKIKQVVSLESTNRSYVGYVYNDSATIEFGDDNDSVTVTLTITQLKRLHNQLDDTLKQYNKVQAEKAYKALEEEEAESETFC